MARKGVMLCYPYEPKRLRKWKASYVMVQPKLDGDRCRAVFDASGMVTLLSSEENIITNLPHINAELETFNLQNVFLDGEVYLHGTSHEEIHGMRARTVNLESNSLEYHVFDMVWAMPVVQSERYAMAEHRIKRDAVKYVKLVPNYRCSSEEEIELSLQRFVDDGYEGMVVKNPSGIYVPRRSTDLMKFKPGREDMYEIVAYQEEIDKNGFLKDSLGALICRGDDGSLFGVGTGFTYQQRQELWKARILLIGKYCKVKYQHKTTARGVPRHAVFVDICDSYSNPNFISIEED